MLLKRALAVMTLGVTLSAAAHAGDPVQSDQQPHVDALLDPRVLLGGLVTEDDVGLLFAHLRAAMLAAAEGREPSPLPEALGKRLESAGGELRLRGLLAGMALTQFVERAVRDAVRELAPPPTPRDGI
ncbi:MAG: hypothetical protein H6R21_2050 [Proteobacteria bacterium]|nr:hypothetical protein [Pseudomonadota bacterium]